MKIKLKRKGYINNNCSLFFINRDYILGVCDTNGNRLKYSYHVNKGELSVFGNFKEIQIDASKQEERKEKLKRILKDEL